MLKLSMLCLHLRYSAYVGSRSFTSRQLYAHISFTASMRSMHFLLAFVLCQYADPVYSLARFMSYYFRYFARGC